MLDRTIQPDIINIQHIDFRSPELFDCQGAPFYHMKEVPNETSRLDLYFDAGRISGKKNLASIVNGMLLAGTHNQTSNQLNERINELGAFMESGVSMENATVSVYCLRENILQVFNVIHEAIVGAVFPQNELDEIINDRKQGLKINLEKVSFNAQRELQRRLFSSDERYAVVSELHDFDSITRKDVIDFHQKFYLNGLQKVVLVSNVEQNVINELISQTAEFKGNNTTETFALINRPETFHKEMADALQTAIRIGRILFNKTHEDYLDFLVLNTILGDYFGSRLMKNIREDKGFTYGIGSMMIEFEKTGYFLIATEVGKDVVADAMREIKYEIEKLQNELINEEELDLVRNYMLGQLLKSADGPYAMTDLFLSAIIHGKDLEFYNQAIDRINSIDSERIRDLAIKYLNWNDFTIITAG